MLETIVFLTEKDNKTHEFRFDVPASLANHSLEGLKLELTQAKRTLLESQGHTIITVTEQSIPSPKSMKELLQGSFLRGSPLQIATRQNFFRERKKWRPGGRKH